MIELLITNKTNRIYISIFLFLFLIVSGNNLYSSIGLSLSLYVFLLFINNLGGTIPVIEFMSLLLAFQLIISTYNAYVTGFQHYRYGMAVSENEYMSITVPLFIAFLIPAMKYKKKFIVDDNTLSEYIASNPNLPFVLISIGIVSIFIRSSVPPALSFIFYLASLTIFIGAISILYSSTKYKWLIFIAIMLYPLIRSINSGMFGSTIYTYAFVGMFVIPKFNFSKSKILLYFIVLMFSITTIQAIKASYRDIIWKGYGGNKLELFWSLWKDQLFGQHPEVSSEEIENSINIRFNQGWIVSKIYAYIPKYSTGLNGKTIIEAIDASLLPRFISPRKKSGSDSKRDFELMTGLKLGKGTAMGTSILGEAYGNFVFWGGMAFMYVWGLFMAYITKIYNKLINKDLLFLLFIPLLYLMSIRAESTVLATLNWFVKSGIFILLIYYILKSLKVIRPNDISN